MNRAAAFGKAGGLSKSPLKTAVARQTALLRKYPMQNGVLPIAVLLDGAWYSGSGKYSDVAKWIASRGCFLTFDGATPVEERHRQDRGTFSPQKLAGAPPYTTDDKICAQWQAEKARDRVLSRLAPAPEFKPQPPDYDDPEDFVGWPLEPPGSAT